MQVAGPGDRDEARRAEAHAAKVEQQAAHFRRALEEILAIARSGLAGRSASLSLLRIEGRAESALASTKVEAPNHQPIEPHQ